MNPYYAHYLYRLEHGLSTAEERALDLRSGELAAAVADARSTVAHSLGRVFGTLKALARVNRTRKEASAAAALAGH